MKSQQDDHFFQSTVSFPSKIQKKKRENVAGVNPFNMQQPLVEHC